MEQDNLLEDIASTGLGSDQHENDSESEKDTRKSHSSPFDSWYRSNVQKTLFFIFSTMEVLCISGIIYGWTSFDGIFKSERFYQDLCYNSSSVSTKSNVHCDARVRKLNLIFLTSVSILTFVKFLAGVGIHKIGARKMRSISILLLAVGGYGLAFVTSEDSYLLFPVFICISSGGAVSAVTIYQTANILFFDFKALVLCILNGAFDSSAVMTLVFKVAYVYGFSLRDIMLLYTSMSIVLSISITLILVPPQSLTEVWFKEDDIKRFGDQKRVLKDKRNTGSLGEDINMILHHVFSALFLTELFWFSFIQLRLWFFVGSLHTILEEMTGGDLKTIDLHLNIFNITMLFGILTGPVIGVLFDRKMLRPKKESQQNEKTDYSDRLWSTFWPYVITLFLCVVLQMIALTKKIETMILIYILYMVIRGFLYACHTSFLGIAFPSDLFGILFGLSSMVSGVFGFLQHFLLIILLGPLEKNTFWMDFALLLGMLICIIQPCYLRMHVKKIRKTFKDTTRDEQVSLIKRKE